ncbi:MAG: DEAD/DEAH box helicase family protein [Allobaculum sp.]
MSLQALTGGDKLERQFFNTFKTSLSNANGIDLIVSFLMESGVRMLIEELQDAIDRHVPVRILTGNYLGITQPSALYMLKQRFRDAVEIRFYDEKNRSFHAKSYILHYENENEIYVGSSNISRSAFTSGIEWNYRFSDHQDADSYQVFYNTFIDLYENHSVLVDDDLLAEYRDQWHKPHVYHDLERYDNQITDHEESPVPETKLQPRGPQIEALYSLERIREEGANRALVQAATGIGKTYLAAFDSLKFHRILFVAHRHEILAQAAESFHQVRPSDSSGFFEGKEHNTEAQMIFASVETLGKKQYLELFKRNAFDYIVVDEFHHAVAGMYQNLLQYFKPKFLLGLTATPERMDGCNIYELCDYNVAFEMPLAMAINQGYLTPFHYYGIFDDIEYNLLPFDHNRYRQEDLNKVYIGNEKRYELILKSYRKYPSKRALAFCASKKHAEDMSRVFNEHHIPAAAVYSGKPGPYALERNEALEKLKNGELRVLFSIDMFNEGLDVPDLDMVMFLRPTESPVVFLQQLGRGLRKAQGKDYLNVLDFIGNYAKASRAPRLLAGIKPGHAPLPFELLQYPDQCIVDFDLKLLDLFHKMDQRSLSVSKRIENEIERIMNDLGHVPSRMECFTYMQEELYDFCMARTKENPFRDYLGYLHDHHWLNKEQEELYASPVAYDFLHMLETTSMSKVYKMPVLQSFYNHGVPRMEITDQQVLETWKEFFNTGMNWRDLDPKSSREKFEKITDRSHLSKIRQMPIHFLLKSAGDFFVEKPGFALALKPELKPFMDNEAFIEQFGDIISYRTMHYYRSRYMKKKEKQAH